jgi:hypothetical protein
MQRIVLIFSLSLAIIFLTGHYFIYKSVLKSHKREFQGYIRSHHPKIEVLEISPSELYADNARIRWKDENKEICLNGVMFDIIRIVSGGAKVKLFAVNDKDEKELMDLYSKQFNDQYENGVPGKKNNNLLKELLSFKYLSSNSREIVLQHSLLIRASDLQSKLCLGHLTVLTLPPNA